MRFELLPSTHHFTSHHQDPRHATPHCSSCPEGSFRMRANGGIGSSPDTRGLSHEPNQSTSDDARPVVAEQACRECRRRKSKCDRIVPICHLCGKFNRRCTYEKFTRTPLTRTYLTKVESELARTKSLLRQMTKDSSNENPTLSKRNTMSMGDCAYNAPHAQQFMLGESATASHEMPIAAESVSPQQRAHLSSSTHRVHPRQNEGSGLEGPSYPANVAGTSLDAPRARQFISEESTDPSNTTFNYGDDNAQRLAGTAEASTLNPSQSRIFMSGDSTHAVNTISSAFDESRPSHGQAPQRNMRPSSVSQSVGTSALLETPPSATNFEWDERTGGASAGQFVDGMASLTSRSNEGGYLGMLPTLSRGSAKLCIRSYLVFLQNSRYITSWSLPTAKSDRNTFPHLVGMGLS